MSWLRVGLASLAASMAVIIPAAAGAQTFCVRGAGDAPGCGAAPVYPTIQAAIDAAAAASGPDRVQLEGTLPEQGFTIGAGNVVDVDGTDADQLTIGAPDTITVQEPDASISHALIVYDVVPDVANVVALDLIAGTLEDSVVVGAYSDQPLVRLGDATLDGVQFADVEHLGTAVNAVGPGGVIADSGVVGGTAAVTSSSDGLAVRGSVLLSNTAGGEDGRALEVTAGNTTVDDTLVLLEQGTERYGSGVSVVPAAGGTASLALRSVTVAADHDSDVSPLLSQGLYTSCSGGATAQVSLLDTAVAGFGTDLDDIGCGIALDHVRYGSRIGSAYADGPSVLGGAWSTGWVAAPVFGSSLIDTGSDRGGDVTDFEGLPRVVDGDGDGVAHRDIGAWEYQRRAPEAVLKDQHVATGTTVEFDGSHSDDPDDGDFGHLTYAWQIDGVADPQISGTITTAFDTPGAHAVSLTVTDPAGLSDTATATVTADGPAPPTPGPAPLPGGTLEPRHVTPIHVTPIKPPVAPAKKTPSSAVLLDRHVGRAGTLRVRVTCGTTVTNCRGRVQLRVGTGKRAVVIGRSHEYALFAGRSKTVAVKLNAVGRRLLRAHRAKGVVVGVRMNDAFGTSYTSGHGGRVRP